MVVIGGGVTADQASNSILSESRLYSKLYITQYGNFKSFMTLPENLQQWSGAAKATAVWGATSKRWPFYRIAPVMKNQRILFNYSEIAIDFSIFIVIYRARN